MREVFAHLEKPEPGPWSTVLGMIADFLTVRREYAPLIETNAFGIGSPVWQFVIVPEIVPRGEVEQGPGANLEMRVCHGAVLLPGSLLTG